MSTQLQEGETYRIVKPGASLQIETSTGRFSWRTSSHSLEVGTTVTYLGKTPGLGHDNVSQDTFEAETGERGKFRPNSWGSANTSYLEEVE